MRVYYVNLLSLTSGARVALAQVTHRRSARLVFLEPGRGHTGVQRILRWMFGIAELEHCTRESGDFRDDDGVNLFWFKDAVMCRVASRTLGRIDWNRIAGLLQNRYPPAQLRLFAERQLNHDLYVELGRCCMLTALMAEARPSEDNAILIPRSPFSAAIAAELRPASRIYTYATFVRLLRPIRDVLALAKHVLWAVATLARPESAERRPQSNRVAVQFSAGVDPTDRNDLFWYQASGLNPERLLIYLDGEAKTRRCTPDVRQRIAEAGIELVDLNAWQPRRRCATYIAFLLQLIVAIGRIAFARNLANPSLGLWLAASLGIFARAVERWSRFFNEHRVAMHLHVSDSDPLLVAKVLAIEGAGGIDLSFQFSGTGWLTPMGARPVNQHQFFSWGSANAEMIQRCDSICPGKAPNVHFIGGHPYQYTAAFHQDDVAREQKALREDGRNYVIAVFDNVASDRDSFISRTAFNQFYRSIANIAARNARIGLLLKPQAESAMDQDVVQQLWTLERRGQLRRLPSATRTFQVFPHADLAIGMGAHSSAMMEAAIAEVPHIYYDTCAWHCHIFYDRLPKGLIAQTEEDLQRLVSDHMAGRAMGPDDPAYRAYLDWIDPFRDGRGHERFGRLIGWFAELLDAHGHADLAVPEAAARYREAYGDHAIRVVRWPYAGTTGSAETDPSKAQDDTPARGARALADRAGVN